MNYRIYLVCLNMIAIKILKIYVMTFLLTKVQ